MELDNRLSRIVNTQTGNFIMQGNWTVTAGGTITTGSGSRILMLPEDRSQSTSGFIEFLATNANWPETIPGLGNSAHINRNASNHR